MLLSDAVMAGINGRELANLVLERRPGIALILMAEYTDHAIAHHKVVDPRTKILDKPFSPGQWLAETRREERGRGWWREQ